VLEPFQLLGAGHVGAIIVLAGIAVMLIQSCRRDPSSAQAKSGLTLLAFFCLAAYPINQAAWISMHGAYQLDAIVPFHLCDLAAFFCGFALITASLFHVSFPISGD